MIFYTDENGHRRFKYTEDGLAGYINPTDWSNLIVNKIME